MDHNEDFAHYIEERDRDRGEHIGWKFEVHFADVEEHDRLCDEDVDLG